MEEVLFEVERRHSRDEIAEFLYDAATSVHEGEMTVASGDEEVSLEIPDEADFEVKIEREDEGSGEEYSIEFEIEWKPGEGGGELRLE